MSKFLSSISVLIPFLLSAYVMYTISFVIVPLAHYLSTSVPNVVLAITLSWIGGGIGGFVFGRLSDLIGRKKALIISFFLFSIPAILLYFVNNLLELYILWFIIGFGVNGENGISYVIIAELRLTNLRGFLGGMMQGFYALGALLGAITTTFMGDRFLLIFLIAGIVSLLSFIFYPFIPEEKVKYESRSRLTDIFSQKMIGLTAISSIASLTSFLYIISAFELLPTILQNNELVAIGDIIAVLSFSLSGYISDIKGRKFSAIIFGILAVISSALFLLSNILALTIYFSSAFFAFFGVWLSELYPPQVRGTGSNFALLIGRIIGGGFGTFIVTLLPFPLKISLGIVLIIASVISVISMNLLRPITN
ncbi:MFS transporter [Sulfurisphaera tokodaii]|uniref:MFS transporter n=2 Tax=Sulfurisphaera tokodaii TaxID=111955 RepID=Q972T1_SULTO|nr:MFS transporter [Sulfurisphaera tokodaii]BAB66082.1 MFS transporter [Sulfurisphaera tokodaii str. 7]HII75435.1 MFS transporter [Sulfurisphaera tokodaii]